MKFKIDEFFTNIFAALLLYFGVLLIQERRDIGDIVVGIIFFSISIFIFIIKSLDFENKSKVEKAEEKAIKYRDKLKKKDLKQRSKEYKLLKKEIFKCIIKGLSSICVPVHTDSLFILRDKLNGDIDFKGLHFTAYEVGSRICWERRYYGRKNTK